MHTDQGVDIFSNTWNTPTAWTLYFQKEWKLGGMFIYVCVCAYVHVCVKRKNCKICTKRWAPNKNSQV